MVKGRAGEREHKSDSQMHGDNQEKKHTRIIMGLCSSTRGHLNTCRTLMEAPGPWERASTRPITNSNIEVTAEPTTERLKKTRSGRQSSKGKEDLTECSLSGLYVALSS